MFFEKLKSRPTQKAIVAALIAFAATPGWNKSESDGVKFTKKTILVDGHKIDVEIAETTEQQMRGLMFRRELKAGSGMLFIYQEEQPLSFWMKNTFIPLSIGFFNAEMKLVDVQDMAPVQSEIQTNIPTYRAAKPAKYALEVPQGWFRQNGIKVGAKLALGK